MRKFDFPHLRLIAWGLTRPAMGHRPETVDLPKTAETAENGLSG